MANDSVNPDMNERTFKSTPSAPVPTSSAGTQLEPDAVRPGTYDPVLSDLADETYDSTLNADQREEFVSELNEILKGELSAVETYRQVQETVKGDDFQFVSAMERDHEEAVRILRDHITALGGQPEQTSGAWGAFAKSVTGAAKLFGDKLALKALREGEEKGLSDYEQLLDRDNIPEDVAREVRMKFIPKQRSHIQKLKELMH